MDGLEEVRRLGVYGLRYLGAPIVWDFKTWTRDPTLFSAVWLEKNIFNRRVFCYAEIYAVLWVLQYDDLIEIVSIDHGGLDQALWLDFRYTPLGIQTILERRNDPSMKIED